jgi:hypothetical protein
MLVPEARLSKITAVRSEGVCNVDALPAACGAGVTCQKDMQGQTIAIVTVSASKRGACNLTVDYSDGCPSETLAYEFAGPMENCCGDVCAKRAPNGPVSSGCPK